MEEMDTVEVIVEKERYVKHGVHKGMQGWICLDYCVDGYWYVNFPQRADKYDIATISVHEKDMKEIPRMDPLVNEKIKEQFGD